MFKVYSVGSKGPKACQENTPLVQQTELLIQGGMDPSFEFVCAGRGLAICLFWPLFTGHFIVFEPFSVNLRDMKTYSGSTVSEILRPAHQALTTIPSSNTLFSLHSNARFELQQVALTMSIWLDALACLHVIGWCYICVSDYSFLTCVFIDKLQVSTDESYLTSTHHTPTQVLLHISLT